MIAVNKRMKWSEGGTEEDSMLLAHSEVGIGKNEGRNKEEGENRGSNGEAN